MKRLHTVSKPVLFLAILVAIFAVSVSSRMASAQTLQSIGVLAEGLTERQRAEAERGRRLFNLRFLPVPPEGLPGGGLGPLYMRSTCSACHRGTGRGDMPESGDVNLIGGAVYLGQSHLAYGAEIHPRSVPPVPHEGDASLIWEVGEGAFLDGETFSLRVPKVTVSRENYGTLPSDLSLRIAPPLRGLGLLEAIPDIEILTWADPEDLNGDGVSGRPNFVSDPVFGGTVLGRFGWKADRSSVSAMNAWSAMTFMGLTSSPYPSEPCAPSQVDCLSHSIDKLHDLADGVLRDMTAYITALQRPIRRDVDNPLVLRGQDVFRSVDCHACHRERMTTAIAVPGSAFLSGQQLYAYTDLLLHDMGDELDDGRQSFRAASYEWRTAPLWGLGRSSDEPGTFGYMHDGRAQTLTEAILWHGGEALASRNAFFVLSKEDRDALIAFLHSL